MYPWSEPPVCSVYLEPRLREWALSVRSTQARSSSTETGASEEIRIGVYEPMTGPMAAGGQAVWQDFHVRHGTVYIAIYWYWSGLRCAPPRAQVEVARAAPMSRPGRGRFTCRFGHRSFSLTLPTTCRHDRHIRRVDAFYRECCGDRLAAGRVVQTPGETEAVFVSRRAVAVGIVLVLTAVVAVGGCQPAGGPQEAGGAGEVPEEIKIGVYEPMTGAMAAGGQMTWEGIQLANETKGTVLGKPVTLALVDNKSDKVEAANAVARLIDKEKVVAIVGSYGSSLSMAGGPIAEKAGIPVVGCSPTNPLVTQGLDYYFRACFIDPFQGAVMARFAYNELGARRAAIIQDVAQDYSVGLANFFREEFMRLTGEPKSIVALTSYQTGDQDFTAQLTHVAAHDPEVIFIPGYYGDGALIIKQARGLGIDVPFLGGDAFEAPEFIQIGGEQVEGVAISSHYSADAPLTSASEKFVADYRAKFDKEPNAFAALGYDAYMLILDAIERAGSADPKAIRDALAETKGFEGVTGVINIDKTGDAVKSAVVLQVKGGKFTYRSIVHPD